MHCSSLFFYLEQNKNDPAERSFNKAVEFSGQNVFFILNQKSVTYISVNPTTVSMAASANTKTVTIDTDSQSWDISSRPNWITYSKSGIILQLRQAPIAALPEAAQLQSSPTVRKRFLMQCAPAGTVCGHTARINNCL